MPCYDEKTHFIGQKTCGRSQRPLPGFDWKIAQMAGSRMGVSATVVLGFTIAIGAILVASFLCCFIRKNEKHWRKKFELGVANEADAMIMSTRDRSEEKNKYGRNDESKNNNTVLREYRSSYINTDDDHYLERDQEEDYLARYDNYNNDDDMICAIPHSPAESISPDRDISFEKSGKVRRRTIDSASSPASDVSIDTRRFSYPNNSMSLVIGKTTASPGAVSNADYSDVGFGNITTEMTDSSTSHSRQRLIATRRSNNVHELQDLLDVPVFT